MYICDFSRSDGAGSAMRRNTRGLTRSVIARIVPPLPAASRPSNTMITRSPLCFTHSCSLHHSPGSLRSSFADFLPFILPFSPFSFFMPSLPLRWCLSKTHIEMQYTRFPARLQREPGALEHLQHRPVSGQDLGDQRLESRRARAGD